MPREFLKHLFEKINHRIADDTLSVNLKAEIIGFNYRTDK